MKIFELEIEKIKPYQQNAKIHTDTQIENVAMSIKKYGWQQPLVVSKDYELIIGHCRLLAAKALGLKTVPVVVADKLTDKQVKELRLVDNKTNESVWDLDFLSLDLEGLDLSEFSFDFKIPDIKPLEEFDDEEPEEDDCLVEKKLLRCPCCGHINEEKAFKTYNEDTK